MDSIETDVLVVGAGIAGLAAALAADREGADVTLVTKAARPEETATWRAQGGIAVARDDPAQFKRDIIDASDGTADPEAVDILVEHADAAVRDVLIDSLGIDFDMDGEDFDYGREAAHDRPRILHVDAITGKRVHLPFLNHVADRTGVTVHEDTAALELISHEGKICGAVLERDGEWAPAHAGATVLATGGIGALYSRSTNPAGSTGDGIAMAALAGADVREMEYVQFHPTVCHSKDGAKPASNRCGDAGEGGTFLVSEAVRGQGAILRNAEGERFMPEYHPDAELAPRDVVARAAARSADTARGGPGTDGVGGDGDRTFSVRLDVSPLDFAGEFPTLAATCEEHGVDWRDGIPVAPAQHFLCGGIAVDDRGRSSLDGLYAVGECARTGVHGANRLASTSLLEGLVWGLRAGEGAVGRSIERVEPPALRDSDPALPPTFANEKLTRLRRVMDEHLGIERHPGDIDRARSVLRRLKGEVDAYARTRTSRSLYELRSATVVALLIARAAAENETSAGCHHLVEAAEVNAD